MPWTRALIVSLAVTLGACGGGGGGGGDSGGNPVAPTVTLDAAPVSVVSGGAATLNWDSTDATDCAASGGWSGSRASSGSERTGPLTASTTHTLTCTGPGGTAAQTVTVTVTAPPAPVVTLTANPTTINAGAASTLTWMAADATTCTASGSWNGAKSVSGSEGTGALSGNASYALNCIGPGGSASQTASVTVIPAVGTPTVNFAANPSNVISGNPSTLTWSTTNAAACTATGGWSGGRSTSGSAGTGNLAATTGYTLACTGPGGSASQTVTVTVTPPAPTITFSASPTSVASGASSTLTWSTTNATTCTASGGWIGPKATSEIVSTGTLTSTTTFTLTCTGTGGSANQSATVTVVPAPTVTLTASPTSVASGVASTLTWSTSNATDCTASGGWTGAKATSGTADTGALTSTSTFGLNCSGSGGTAMTSATVVVTQVSTGSATISWLPPTENTDGTPLTDLAGFRIYYGTSASTLTQTANITNPGVTTYVVQNLVAATWYFTVQAYAADGTEGVPSNITSKTIQ